MESALATPAAARPLRGITAPDAEKVSLRRIRLALPRQHIIASVGSFFAADKVLSAWAGRADGMLECEFEIVYDDGHTLAGEYRFQRKAANRPALMGFIRQAARTLSEGCAGASLVRGLSGCPQGFLDHYETADTACGAQWCDA